MKNYDDLQRFKDKTRTGAIEFKDMSAQNKHSDTSNWAIIKQLMNTGDDDSVLSHAGSIAVPAPQAVKADEFDASHFRPLAAQPVSNTASQGSILNSLNSALPAAKTATLPTESAQHSTATSPHLCSSVLAIVCLALLTVTKVWLKLMLLSNQYSISALLLLRLLILN